MSESKNERVKAAVIRFEKELDEIGVRSYLAVVLEEQQEKGTPHIGLHRLIDGSKFEILGILDKLRQDLIADMPSMTRPEMPSVEDLLGMLSSIRNRK